MSLSKRAFTKSVIIRKSFSVSEDLRSFENLSGLMPDLYWKIYGQILIISVFLWKNDKI
ncbi:Uncharacterized protein dnm_095870 [Desulfonema magnum]|uniref:Uncharacterized protein n=1 Tax=Desulfonema magnum TaxID=45655 RepID=A0A975BX93_9BACT|nr:Uncharacterized protein dnm_095870 [Desulfonema magnum]